MGDKGGTTVGCCVMETEGEYFTREQIDLQCLVMARGDTEDPFKWTFPMRSNCMVDLNISLKPACLLLSVNETRPVVIQTRGCLTLKTLSQEKGILFFVSHFLCLCFTFSVFLLMKMVARSRHWDNPPGMDRSGFWFLFSLLCPSH